MHSAGSSGRGHHQTGATCTASVPRVLSLVPDIYGNDTIRMSAYQVPGMYIPNFAPSFACAQDCCWPEQREVYSPEDESLHILLI